MIKPAFLWALCKECPDSKWIGDICRALGGQDVPLDFGQQRAFGAIQNDSKWMDERLEFEKERHRRNMAAYRERNRNQVDDGVTVTGHGDGHVIPSLRPSLPPSLILPEYEREDAPAPTRGDVPALSVVVSAATSVMGVPEYYARWWYGEMNARDWRKTDGGAIGNGNWRAVLKSWWNKETDAHKAEIKAEAEKPAPVPVTFTAEDWQLCRERCAHCGPCGCQKGAKTPPQLDATHPHTPEECPRYAKKREIQPATPSAPPGRTRTPPKRTNAPQGRKSTDFEPSAVPEP